MSIFADKTERKTAIGNYSKRLILNFPAKSHCKSPAAYARVKSHLVALVAYLKTDAVRSFDDARFMQREWGTGPA